MDQKIKVRRSDLITAVKQHIDELATKADAWDAEQQIELDQWKVKAEGWIADAFKHMKLYEPLNVNAAPTHPSQLYRQVQHEAALAEAKKHLRMLEMCSDETITLTGADFSKYVG